MLFEKSINVHYSIDQMGGSYEREDSKELQKTQESQEVSKEISDSLGKLLENVDPGENLKEIYTDLSVLTENKTIPGLFLNKLFENQTKLLTPEYKEKKESQEAIKIYDVIFLEQDASVEDAVGTISKAFDDKDIPKGIKLKLSKYLRENTLSYMVHKAPGFENIDNSKLDKDLKDIYETLPNYEGKVLSMKDYDNLVSYQEKLYSPKYQKDPNALILQDILANIMRPGSVPVQLDMGKGVEISNKLYEKYQGKYNFKVVGDDGASFDYTSPGP